MKVILLSGGSGTRLWPLSNEARSKQFLEVLQDEKGRKQSMMQRIYFQIKKRYCSDDIYIATNANQVDSIKRQIGEDVKIVIEPERRNTWPAIALSVSNLYFNENCTKDEIAVVLPIDPFVEDHYFDLLASLEKIIKKDEADIALMGVKPTQPDIRYGYVIPESVDLKNNNILKAGYKVHSFIEKPNEDEAKELIFKKGALWNCGVFAFKIGYLMDILSKKIIYNHYIDVLDSYQELKKTSFDYEVVENADRIAVIEYKGIWKDLGTWKTLCEHISESIMGNAVVSTSAENVNVINELEIPTVVIGAKNTVVVATHDGILVSDKDQSSNLKDYLGKNVLRPMCEKRQWGSYYILEHNEQKEGIQSVTKKLIIESGKNISYQYHQYRSEVWTVIGGMGIFILNNKIYPAKTGSVFKIKTGDKHTIRSIEKLTMIEVQLGTNLVEDDIIRIEKNWDKILLMCELSQYDN